MISRTDDSPRGTETILLVEDEDALRVLIATMLTRLGYSVIQAQDGFDALALADDPKVPIDLLVTDAMMPGMDGPALVSALQEQRGTRALLMSGYTGEALAARDDVAPDLPTIQKPFSMSEFAQRVREVLDS